MRLLRNGVSLLARRLATALEHDRRFTAGAIGAVAGVLPTSARTRAYLRSRWFIDLLLVFCRALADSPPGRPLRFDQPLLISMGVTASCPLKCAVCYSDSKPDRSGAADALDLQTIKALSETDTPCFLITGGEPLLAPGFQEKLEVLLARGKYVYVASNLDVGSLEPLARRYPHQISLVLSLWGRAEQHDARRGARSYQRLRENIEKTTDWPCHRILYCVLRGGEAPDDAETLSAAAEFAPFAADMDAVITRVIQVGRLPAPSTRAFQTTDAVNKGVRALGRRYRRVFVEIPEYQGTKRTANRAVAERLLAIRFESGCGAGRWVMHVDGRGRYAPCFAFDGHDVLTDDASASVDAGWRACMSYRDQDFGAHPCLAEAAKRDRNAHVSTG